MNLWRIYALGPLLTLALACNTVDTDGTAARGQPGRGASRALPPPQTGDVTVKFRQSASRSERSRALSALADHVTHLEDHNLRPGGQRGPAVFDRLAFAQLRRGADLAKTLEQLNRHPLVEYAQPNFIVNALSTPNDPDFSKLWGLHNTGQTGGTADADIDATEAWDIGTGSDQIVVAVIDTGIEYTHPDLAANMWTNSDEIPGNGIDDDLNGRVDDIYGYDFVNRDADPMDDHFHGTHVSGTVAGVGNNGIGVAGVAWNARLMALKFLSSGGSGNTQDAVLAIQYAINNGAQVMSNSWGGSGHDQALQDAITVAYNAGIVFVAAAGNSNTDAAMYPASYENVISVSAVDHNDGKDSFSNYGSHIDVGAPGVSIYSATLGGGYRYASGTSMACPHVAGLAALLLGRNATLSPSQIENILETSADDLGTPGWDAIYGAGRINAQRSLAAVDANQVLFPNAKITSPVNGALLGGVVQVMGTADGSAYAYHRVDFSGSTDTTWHTIASSTAPVSEGFLATWDTTSLSDGPYSLRLAVGDALGREVQRVTVVNVDNVVAVLDIPRTVGRQESPSLEIRGSSGLTGAGSFTRYLIEYGVGFSPTTFTTTGVTLVGGGLSPIQNGTLGTLDVSPLEGFYTVRLTTITSLAQDSETKLLYVDPYLRPGWPQLLPALSNPALAVGDVDGSPGKEVLVPAYDGLYAYDANGNFLFAHDTQDWFGPKPIEPSTPALAEATGSPGLEAAFSDGYVGRLFVTEGAQVAAGFPVRPPGPHLYDPLTTTPMAYNLDGAGAVEWLMPSVADFEPSAAHLNAYDVSANAVPGFPFTFPYSFPMMDRGAAVGDLDGDGAVEIFFSVLKKTEQYNSSTIVEATLLGIDAHGNLLPGYPETFLGVAGGSREVYLGDITIVDINGDGTKEMAFIETALSPDDSVQRFAVHVRSKNGTPLAGWPFLLEGADNSSALGYYTPSKGGMLALGDTTGDGMPEIVASPNMGWDGGTTVGSKVVYVLSFDGTTIATLNNFYRNEYGHGGAASPTGFSLADVTEDGRAEVLMNMPIYIGPSGGGTFMPALLVYDLSASSTAPIMTFLARSMVNSDGVRVYPSNSPRRGPVVDDLDGDGQAEILQAYWGIAGATSGIVNHTFAYAWSIPAAITQASLEWSTLHGNLARTGEYIPQSQRGGQPTPPPPPPQPIPVPVLLSPLDGTSTSDTTPTFDWSDVTSSTAVTYELQVDDATSFASPVVNQPGLTSSTSTASALGVGTYYWRVRARDATNTGAWSAAWSFNLTLADTTGPLVTFQSPTGGQTVRGHVMVQVGATDPSGVARVELFVNGQLFGSDSVAPYDWRWNSRSHRRTDVTLKAKAYDSLGNSSVTEIVVHVN